MSQGVREPEVAAEGRDSSLPRTTTSTRDRNHRTAPVHYLRQWPNGPLYRLADYMNEPGRNHWIVIGRASFCDIVLNDDTVSKVHCTLLCNDRGVGVRDDSSHNRTLVNRVPLRNGEADLVPGNLLEVGDIRFVACDESGEAQDPDIVAPNLDRFTTEAVDIHGSETKAATALGAAPSTFIRWLRNRPFLRRLMRRRR